MTERFNEWPEGSRDAALGRAVDCARDGRAASAPTAV